MSKQEIWDKIEKRYNEYLKAVWVKEQNEEWFKDDKGREMWGKGFEDALMLIKEVIMSNE